MGGVIKQKAYDRLHPINLDFDDIFPYEEGASIVGRVLGKIEKEMIPSMEEQSLYLEAVETLDDKYSIGREEGAHGIRALLYSD